MTWFTFGRTMGFILITGFTCTLFTGLLLTFATSGGISAGAVPLTIAGCILVFMLLVFGLHKILMYFDV